MTGYVFSGSPGASANPLVGRIRPQDDNSPDSPGAGTSLLVSASGPDAAVFRTSVVMGMVFANAEWD